VTLAIGRTIDRYVVESVLGEGGMAVVYRVRHGTLGTAHALKVLKTTEPAIRDRMLREGQVQASLRHPNIVAVTDVLQFDGSVGLVLEYVEGISLREACEVGRLYPTDALAVFRAVSAGVAYAHHRGLVHRDLKPDNVLLAVEHGRLVPKVADFGLVKALADAQVPGHHRTSTGMAMGTPAYMSPEQINDSSRVDRRTDMWSLGCILYVLVTGHMPFPQRELISLFRKIADGVYVPPREISSDVPVRVSEAIAGLLQPDPKKRFADCAAVLAWLDEKGDVPPVYDVDIGALPPADVVPLEAGPFLLPSSSALAKLVSARLSAARPSMELRASTPPVEATVSVLADQTGVRSLTTMPPPPASPQGSPTLTSGGALSFPPGPLPPVASDPATRPNSALARWPFIVGGAVALSALIGTIAVLSGEAPAPAPPPAPAPAEEAPVVAAPVAEPEPSPEPAPAAETAPARVVPSAPVKKLPKVVKPPVEVAPPPPPAEPEPAPEPKTGTFTFTGADAAWLVGADGREHRGREVPPGAYKVMAVFPGRADAVSAGSVTVKEGAESAVKCVAAMTRCGPK
jgi:serine/threonine protein kinase